MKVALGIELSVCDEFIELEYNPLKAGLTQVKYHASSKKLDEYLTIDVIFIPAVLEGIEYDASIMLDHLRLSPNKAVRETTIVIVTELVDSFKPTRELERHLEYNVEVMAKDETNGYNKLNRSKNTEKLDFIIHSIGKTRSFTGRHNAANIWGPYKLIQGYHKLSGNAIPTLEELKDKLSEDTFFKKKILFEDCSVHGSVSKKTISKLRESLSKCSKILIIEDELDRGWKDVYTHIFIQPELAPLIEFESCYERALSKNAKDYDLILLDLRLNEPSSGEATDITEIRRTKGIQLLQRYKKDWKWTPVIITTASNKVWSSQAAMDEGANGFWSKEGIEYNSTLEFTIENTERLLSIIIESVEWSKMLEPLALAFTAMYNSCIKFHKQLTIATKISEKADIFSAITYTKNSSFVESLSQKMQLNLAYLVAFSLNNQIRELVLDYNRRIYRLKQIKGFQEFGEREPPKGVKFHESVSRILKVYENVPTSQIDNYLVEFLAILDANNLEEAEELHNEWNYLKGKRNDGPFTHDHQEANHLADIGWEDIIRVLNFYKKIICNQNKFQTANTDIHLH